MPEPYEDTVGRRIIAARMRRGVKQAELARAIGIAANALVKIEKGETKPPRSEVIRDMAQVLGVSTDDLLGLKDEIGSERLAAAVVASCDASTGPRRQSVTG
jgi:transcriptional regulator with XRE-family HTH domain